VVNENVALVEAIGLYYVGRVCCVTAVRDKCLPIRCHREYRAVRGTAPMNYFEIMYHLLSIAYISD